jgi:hypothetical protein
MGSFRAVGFEVKPWPVNDFRSPEPWIMARAVHEWLGLIAYRILGRTGELFPSTAIEN